MSKVKKAGCILINTKEKTVALVYREKKNGTKDYSFPKGHLEGKESLKECAVRETIEETGRDCHIILNDPLGVLIYNTPLEQVETYIFLAVDDGIHIGESVDPEICVWTDLDKVEDTLSYDNLKTFWKEVYNVVEKSINN
jgi:8-oxo-dGTP pyrophosphatase MutT (NUDIX family)